MLLRCAEMTFSLIFHEASQPWRVMANAMNRWRPEQACFWCEEGTTLLDILWQEDVVFKMDTTRMR